MPLIYIVEDDTDILEVESFALKNSGYEVKGFGNAKGFYEAMRERTPELAVLDIMLPDEDGMQIVQKLREHKKWQNLPIIMVTAKTTEIDKVKGLDAGADDYLTKPFGVMELIARVRALLRRTAAEQPQSQPDTLSLGSILLDDRKHAVSVDGESCELTFKEYELLKMFLENAGIVLTRESIMNRIWGVDYSGETRTVDMHIKTLRQKLGSEGNHIRTVRNVGYVIE